MSKWLQEYRPTSEASEASEKTDIIVSRVLDRVESKEEFTVSFLLYRQVKKEALQ